MDWASELAGRFERGFSPTPHVLRTVGREAEYPVVHPDGTAADISVLWPHLAASGRFREQREGDLLVALEGDELTFTAEVGRGTIELIVGPRDDLLQIKADIERGMEAMLAAADAEGLWILGYGVQPVTPASVALMTPKQRYGVLHQVLGDAWLWFTATSADQVHAAVSRDEVVAATNVANLLAPVTVALTANSAIMNGEPVGVCSAREATMGAIHAEGSRHGMVARPSADLADWIGNTFDLHFLMERTNGDNKPHEGSFAQWLQAHHTVSVDDAFAAWLHHDHYIWNSARPRSAHGTVEMRAPCQQPWREHMAASALGVAMLQAHRSIGAFLERELGANPWPAMRQWHPQAVREGLASDEPVPGLIRGVLDRCAEGLLARGRGEEVLLDPLFDRLQQRCNPAQRSVRVFEEEGLAGFLRHVRVR